MLPCTTMPIPERPKNKLVASPKDPRGPFTLLIDRAAGDLNPFLVILAIGLMLLNLTLYLGLAASRHPFVWTQPHEIGSAAATPAAPVDPTTFRQ
jgi:hypothetical protein